MKVLIVNKFLYKNGGAEVYAFKLGEYLKKMGHEVQYFGMDNENRCVGNEAEQYVSEIDFKSDSNLKKIIYPFKTIYSFESKRKIGKVLDEFKPDIVHLNNINYQLTPSIIYEIRNHGIPMVQTVHDPQIVCPNHRFYIEKNKEVCEKCIDGRYINCIKEGCVHGSKLISIVAALESYYYHFRNTYNIIDSFICPSRFMSEKIVHGGIDKKKISVICNFTDEVYDIPSKNSEEKYIIYFGRLSIEKGIKTLIKACRELNDVKFVIVGSGPLENKVKGLKNVVYKGFKTGNELKELISGACLSLNMSEWYENCPLSIIESQSLGTPVLGSSLAGVKELIIEGETGEVFEAGNKDDLVNKIRKLWDSPETLEYMSEECIRRNDNTIDKYYEKLIKIYKDLTQK